jgi:hypothetical protein
MLLKKDALEELMDPEMRLEMARVEIELLTGTEHLYLIERRTDCSEG